MSEDKIIERFADAKVGDYLWRLDPQANNYDKDRNWLGRGVWQVVRVEEVGRQSIVVERGAKFDKKTGEQRGDSFCDHILCGRADREDRRTLTGAPKLGRAVGDCRNIDTLRAIEALIWPNGEHK